MATAPALVPAFSALPARLLAGLSSGTGLEVRTSGGAVLMPGSFEGGSPCGGSGGLGASGSGSGPGSGSLTGPRWPGSGSSTGLGAGVGSLMGSFCWIDGGLDLRIVCRLRSKTSLLRGMCVSFAYFAGRRQLHCCADFGHGLLGPCACPIGTILEDILNLAGGEAGTALLDGIQNLHERVGGPAFAFDASDAGGSAAFVDLGQRFRRGEDLMQIADGALVRDRRDLCGGCGQGR